MPIDAMIAAIDAQIATRKSNRFGIKFGPELYRELAEAGRIQLRTFTMEGTGLFPLDLPAYIKGDMAHAAYSDWELRDYDYVVGVPDDD